MKTKKEDAERANETGGFSEEEKAAMRERAKELKAEAAANRKREEGERDLLEKISEMEEPDRSMAKRLHEIILGAAPDLWPRTWYGMPAYALDGRVVCFFQSGQKFKTRYATLGFSDAAHLDDGPMWPSAYALVELTDDVSARIVKLVQKAVS